VDACLGDLLPGFTCSGFAFTLGLRFFIAPAGRTKCPRPASLPCSAKRRKRKPLQQAPTQVPLVNVQAPEGFLAPIRIVITDANGRRFQVTIDENGHQHPQPVLVGARAGGLLLSVLL
jgi:hypothetical protein